MEQLICKGSHSIFQNEAIIRVYELKNICTDRPVGSQSKVSMTVEDLLVSTNDDQFPVLFIGTKRYVSKTSDAYTFKSSVSSIKFNINKSDVAPTFQVDAHETINHNSTSTTVHKWTCSYALITDDPCIK